jgi:hypothetical protein
VQRKKIGPETFRPKWSFIKSIPVVVFGGREPGQVRAGQVGVPERLHKALVQIGGPQPSDHLQGVVRFFDHPILLVEVKDGVEEEVDLDSNLLNYVSAKTIRTDLCPKMINFGQM